MGRGSSKINSRSSGTPKAITDFEKSIQKSETEKSMIITSSGKQIKFSGDEHHVLASEKDISLLNGAIATHNHPSENTFSSTDIGNGIVKGNLKEMRIVTKSGELNVIKNNGASLEDRRAFSAQYQNQRMRANNNANAKLRRGEKINKDEYVNNHLKNWMENHASEYNLEFKKKKI